MNLTKMYPGGTTALDRLTLSIPAGDLVLTVAAVWLAGTLLARRDLLEL